MGKIPESKKQIRHKEWAAMVRECQASGKKVDVWCSENGIKMSTYYKRLNVLNNELVEGCEKQDIVPISTSSFISAPKNIIASDTGKELISVDDKIIMRKDGIEIELPNNISEGRIIAVIRGLKQC